tara:strand:+ start:7236 stop:7928 length:693 start_codon:yes stop_codon:yes gene_type:complete
LIREIKLSIIIPTLNEAKNLPLLLSDLGEIRDISEILIVDSSSNDATKDISSIYNTKYLTSELKNRGLQLNKGAIEAKGQWFLFIHADSRLYKNWSQEINSIFSKGNKFIYFFRFKVNSTRFIYRFLELFVNLRTLFFKTPYGDQGLLIKKEIFFKYEGYKNIPIMEDIDFINRLKAKEVLKSLNASIFTSNRKWQKRNIFNQALINFNLRRKWSRGFSIDDIYKEYYDK